MKWLLEVKILEKIFSQKFLKGRTKILIVGKDVEFNRRSRGVGHRLQKCTVRLEIAYLCKKRNNVSVLLRLTV